MLSSISPVGEHGRAQRWGLTVGAYVIGSTAGGSVSGALLGGVGDLFMPQQASQPLTLTALAIVAALGFVHEARPGKPYPPSWRRQVDERWLTRYRGWVYGAGFGFQLGAGVVTIVTSSLVYLTFAAALLTASWSGGALVGAAFGIVRSLPLAATWPIRSPELLAIAHRRLQRWSTLVARTTIAVQAVIAVVLGVGALP